MPVNYLSGIQAGRVQPPARNQAPSMGNVAGEFRELFEARKKGAAAVQAQSKGGDSITITQDVSIAQKMDKLKKMHEATDYSGMSDAEAFKVVYDRYYEEFPYLIGKLTVNFEKYEPVQEQFIKELTDAVPGYPYAEKFNKENWPKFEKEMQGYEGLNNKEIIEKVKEQVSDDGSLEAKTTIMMTLWRLEVISDDAFSSFNTGLIIQEREEYKKTFGVTDVDAESSHYRNWKRNGGMENVQKSWNEISDTIFKGINIRKVFGENVENELNELFNILSR